MVWSCICEVSWWWMPTIQSTLSVSNASLSLVRGRKTLVAWWERGRRDVSLFLWVHFSMALCIRGEKNGYLHAFSPVSNSICPQCCDVQVCETNDVEQPSHRSRQLSRSPRPCKQLSARFIAGGNCHRRSGNDNRTPARPDSTTECRNTRC